VINISNGFRVQLDPEHGGRWASLTDASGREWLWNRPDPARFRVRPGDAFVDVGGLEECFPTLAGSNPDHGQIWTRPWQPSRVDAESATMTVRWAQTELARTIVCTPTAVRADYRLRGPAGLQFIWSAHAMLDLTVGARIEADPGPARSWPDQTQKHIDTNWPRPLDIAFDELPDDDGSAMFCLLPDRSHVDVVDGDDRLRLTLDCARQPASFGIWRNLGGYPFHQSETYRSVGVEPMLGRVFDLNQAQSGDAAIVPNTGEVTWQITISTPGLSA